MPVKELDRLRFGPAGIPNSYNGSSEGAIQYVKEIGLDAMELEFVRGVWLKKERADVMKELAKKYDVVLTAHAPYYINLNAKEKKKIEASIKRIVDSAEVLYHAGGFSVVFHPAFYLGDSSKDVTEKVINALKEVNRQLEEKGVDIWVRPELMGKPTQWGSLEELLEVSSELENVEPAIDFAHLHARHAGRFNTEDEWRKVLEVYENILGTDSLKRMHIHISGINYTRKGERNHVNLRESDLRIRELLNVLKEFDVRGVVISESPNIEEDAKFMKELYHSL